jgi:hypothetical protein
MATQSPLASQRRDKDNTVVTYERNSSGDVTTIDLQLGGADEIFNMKPLDFSVNRSLGSQIGWQIRGARPGTCVGSVRIC